MYTLYNFFKSALKLVPTYNWKKNRDTWRSCILNEASLLWILSSVETYICKCDGGVLRQLEDKLKRVDDTNPTMDPKQLQDDVLF